MNKHFLTMACVAFFGVTGTALAEPKVPMFFNLFGPMEWNGEHWEGQNFEPLIRDHQFHLPAAHRPERALFSETSSLTVGGFIENLKRSHIVYSVQNERSLFRGDTGNVVVELGPNFYALSATDQDVIAKLLSRSYDTRTYLLKDHLTKRTVGTITPAGLNLY